MFNTQSLDQNRPGKHHHRSILQNIAHSAMLSWEFAPEFPTQVFEQLAQIKSRPSTIPYNIKDLKHLPWCSIDNNDSEDLDQLTYAKSEDDGSASLFIAVADVDHLIKKGSAIDKHAMNNTTSIYTTAEMFPMLPLEISTNLTSLNEEQDRLAIVTEIKVDKLGKIVNSQIYQAIVHNHAKLTYDQIAAWIENDIQTPEKINRVEQLEESLQLQHKLAQILRNNRYQLGALGLQTIQTRPVFDQEDLQDLEVDTPNPAKELIEDFMIAANTATTQFLKARGYASFRRVVREPENWIRIVEEAAQYNFILPVRPDAKELALFLDQQRVADPIRFPDLSLVIIKLLGRGEYILELANEGPSVGHFGLAIKDYTHSTAPNRRYPDLITQRVLKAAIMNLPSPYSNDELNELAQHCTQREDAANKVERWVSKSAAALLLQSRVGEKFDALCTGASAKGTWVRIFHPPTEGRIVEGQFGLKVGQKIRVQLVRVNVERGFIDFRRI